VELSEKLRHLRHVEGDIRGAGRPLTKAEVARAMRDELGASLSPAYLSQLENGQRRHLTAPTRALLARFFKVHPGYLVGDPEGFERTMRTQELSEPMDLRAWLAERAEELREDPLLYHLFLRLARTDDPRQHLLALDSRLDAAPPGGAVEPVADGRQSAAVAVGGRD
jgi:transcriptional regulator with XRE-family HTH domain